MIELLTEAYIDEDEEKTWQYISQSTQRLSLIYPLTERNEHALSEQIDKQRHRFSQSKETISHDDIEKDREKEIEIGQEL